jgi:hypothetical protein
VGGGGARQENRGVGRDTGWRWMWEEVSITVCLLILSFFVFSFYTKGWSMYRLLIEKRRMTDLRINHNILDTLRFHTGEILICAAVGPLQIRTWDTEVAVNLSK